MRIRSGKEQEFDRLLEQERLILHATETICELIEKRGVSRADLAREIGKSRGFVTQILSGDRNMTLRTLSDFAFALSARVSIDVEMREEEEHDPEIHWEPFETSPNVTRAVNEYGISHKGGRARALVPAYSRRKAHQVLERRNVSTPVAARRTEQSDSDSSAAA